MSKAINRFVFCCKQVREKRKSVREIEDIVWIERNFRMILFSFHRDISYYNKLVLWYNKLVSEPDSVDQKKYKSV
jgi:hypothetical protein